MDSWVFDHNVEAGDIDFFVSRGYVYVIPDERGLGASEGEWNGPFSTTEQEDGFDLVEWIAQQPWCNGNVGMIGISWFGMIQRLVAAQQPPHLKAIFPYEPAHDLYRSAYEGGILSPFWWELEREIPANNTAPESERLYTKEELEARIKEIGDHPDIKYNTNLVRVLARRRTAFFDFLMHPTDGPFWWERSGYTKYDRIKVPVYSGCSWIPFGFKVFNEAAWDDLNDPLLDVPKKVGVFGLHSDITLPGPYELNEEILRWYDHWLKDIDTGIMDEPPIKIFVTGVNKYRYEHEWPLARTQWTKMYLRTFEGLSLEPEPRDPAPDPLVHRPPIISSHVSSIIYSSLPLDDPLEITGPVTLYLYVSVDQEDANLVAKLWSVGPGGDRVPLGRGQLKVSHRALDEEKSKPWRPYHTHTAPEPVIPGEVYEYAIGLPPTSYVFQSGHHMELEVTTADPIRIPWWHRMNVMGPLPSMKLTYYKIYRDEKHQSHVLLPVIPETDAELWV